jgi:hypothetical protein
MKGKPKAKSGTFVSLPAVHFTFFIFHFLASAEALQRIPKLCLPLSEGGHFTFHLNLRCSQQNPRPVKKHSAEMNHHRAGKPWCSAMSDPIIGPVVCEIDHAIV